MPNFIEIEETFCGRMDGRLKCCQLLHQHSKNHVWTLKVSQGH